MKKGLLLLIVIPFLFLANQVSAEKESNLQEEIIYNILIDRYNNGDPTLSEQVRLDDPYAYHGGDLQGITDKLDSIKDLGFTAISLSPIMENTRDGYHGYWIEDFYDVEKQFGTMADFNKLVDEAHKRGIKVILEFVTNYVPMNHPIATDPKKEDWIIQNDVEPMESTTWLENVVVLNQENKQVEDFLMDAAEFWMTETDVDGFKLHAADQSSETFLNTFTKHIKDLNPNFYILAGVLESEEGIEHLRNNSDIQAIDNPIMFEKMNEVFTQVDNPVSALYEAWEESGHPTDLQFVDNQNTARFSNNFADQGRNALTTWKLALTYMYTTPGIPSIYQGSELPMYGPGFPANQQLVQFNSPDPDIGEFHERISSLHAEFPVLSYGDFEQVGVSEGLSVFKRTYEGEAMYVAINNDSESRAVSITGIDSEMLLRGLLGDNTVRENKDGEFRIGIPRETAEVYMIEQDTGFNWFLIGLIAGVFLLFIGVVIYLSRKQKKREQAE